MKKLKIMSVVTTAVALVMISMGMILQDDLSTNVRTSSNINNFKIQNMAASSNMILKSTKEETSAMAIAK